MALLFVGGVMNLLWVAGIAELVLVEKVARVGPYLGQVVGVALAVWRIGIMIAGVTGVSVTISPNYAPGPEPTRSESVRVPCEDQDLREVPTHGAIYGLLIEQAGSEIIVDPHWDIQVERVWAV